MILFEALQKDIEHYRPHSLNFKKETVFSELEPFKLMLSKLPRDMVIQVYTVNSVADISELFNMGVHRVYTDLTHADFTHDSERYHQWVQEGRLIAHRGYRTDPDQENTLSALLSGIEQFGCIETDIHQLYDGTLILFHNDTLDDQPITDFSYDELNQIAMEHDLPFPIPTLRDLLTAIEAPSHHPSPFILEIKDPSQPCAISVVDMVCELNLNDKVMVTSFHLDSTRYARSKDISIGLLY